MKNKLVAAFLSFSFGIFAMQDFYLGKKEGRTTKIILSLVGLSIIPLIQGLIDCAHFLEMDQAEFDAKYNGGKCSDVATLLNSKAVSNVTSVEEIKTAVATKDELPDF